MRETLDCGVLMVPAHAGWMHTWMATHGGDMARVRLHAVPLDEGALVVAANGLATAYAGAPAAAQSLARLAMSLRRFDACLLPVEDLLTLGMRDFVRDPFCPEELRVRVDRVASGRPVRTEAGEPQGREPRCEQRADEFTGAERTTALHEPAALFTRYGATADTPSAATGPALEVRGLPGDSRPRVSREAIDSSLLTIQAAPRIHPDEPFRVAKSRVVDSFERDYVRTALSRHAGNVARAARASSKHRRAFWALMRKHRIEAAPYRMRQERREMSD
jgi:hypothetical protein